MFWKRDDRTEKKLNQMNLLLKKSFANVKRDTAHIFQWINYFYRKNLEQENTIKKLQLELSYVPKTREEIRRIIDDYYSFEGIMGRMRELDHKVDKLANLQHTVESLKLQQQSAQHIHREAPKEAYSGLSEIEKRLEKLEQKKHSIKEKIMKRLTRNSKEYVKSVMISYIKKYGKISALQLKEIVVDEQHFCSKSSSYRLLYEIEDLDDIGVIKQGKEKHYISKNYKRVRQE